MRGQRNLDVLVPLSEQGSFPENHAQHLQPLLLGEHVFSLRAKDDKGRSMAQPSFELLLSYEFQVRKAAIKKVSKGHSWVDSLEEAMVDTLVKERFLTTPLACNSWVATSRSRGRSLGREREQCADRTKGRNKGKPKGKEASGKPTWHSTTPDGGHLLQVPPKRGAVDHAPARVAAGSAMGSHPYQGEQRRVKALKATGGLGWARGAEAPSTCCTSSAPRKGSHPRAASC